MRNVRASISGGGGGVPSVSTSSGDDPQPVFARETRQPADVIEFPVLQLPPAVVGEFPDDPPLARLHLRADDADIFRAQPELPRPPDGHEAVGAFDHRLAGHAAAQDAQAAHVPAAFDEGRAQAERRWRCARRHTRRCRRR